MAEMNSSNKDTIIFVCYQVSHLGGKHTEGRMIVHAFVIITILTTELFGCPGETWNQVFL